MVHITTSSGRTCSSSMCGKASLATLAKAGESAQTAGKIAACAEGDAAKPSAGGTSAGLNITVAVSGHRTREPCLRGMREHLGRAKRSLCLANDETRHREGYGTWCLTSWTPSDVESSLQDPSAWKHPALIYPQRGWKDTIQMQLLSGCTLRGTRPPQWANEWETNPSQQQAALRQVRLDTGTNK